MNFYQEKNELNGLKIAQVSPFVEELFGGSERYCFFLSKFLARKHEVHIFTTKLNRDTPSVEEVEGVIVHRFFTPKIIWNINPVFFILRNLWNESFDVVHVHSHLYFTSIQAAITRIFRKNPLIMHIHGGLGLPPMRNTSFFQLCTKTFYDKIISSNLFRLSDLIASVCKRDLNILGKQYNIPARKLIHIPNAIDTNLFNRRKQVKKGENDGQKIVFVGDMEPWKGPEYIISAYRILKNSGIDAELLMIGDGSLRPFLQKISKGDGITFTGQLPHNKVVEILSEADIFVLPSLWEGAPTVILEAMASGIPVIATTVGGIPELIQDGKTGILVSPRSSVKIAHALKHLIEEPEFGQYLAKNAQIKVNERNNFQNIADITEKIYYKLAGNRR